MIHAQISAKPFQIGNSVLREFLEQEYANIIPSEQTDVELNYLVIMKRREEVSIIASVRIFQPLVNAEGDGDALGLRF